MSEDAGVSIYTRAAHEGFGRARTIPFSAFYNLPFPDKVAVRFRFWIGRISASPIVSFSLI